MALCSIIKQNKTIKHEIIATQNDNYSVSLSLTRSLNEKISKTLFYDVKIVMQLIPFEETIESVWLDGIETYFLHIDLPSVSYAISLSVRPVPN